MLTRRKYGGFYANPLALDIVWSAQTRDDLRRNVIFESEFEQKILTWYRDEIQTFRKIYVLRRTVAKAFELSEPLCILSTKTAEQNKIKCSFTGKRKHFR